MPAATELEACAPVAPVAPIGPGEAAPVHLALRTAPAACVAGRGHDLAAIDAALLAWLALEGPTPRERLAALLWPASSAEGARNALRQRLFRLRRQVGADLVSGAHLLALAANVTHDLDAETAPLGELQLAGCEEFAAWLLARRQAAQAQHRRALVLRIEALENEGDADAALPLACSLLEADPHSEDAHRRVMRLHYLRGDRSAALLAYDRCLRMLKEEIGARPSAPTLDLLRLIDSSREAPAAHPEATPLLDLPPPPPLPHPPHLPAALPMAAGSAAAPPPSGAWCSPLPAALLRPPRLIGRDGERAALLAAWHTGTPALVVGEAGIGKSRLLQSLAAGPVAAASARPGDALTPYASIARLLDKVAVRAQAAVGALPAPIRERLLPLLPAIAGLGDEERGVAPAGAASSATDARAAAMRTGSLAGPVAALLQQCTLARSIDGLVLDDLHFADAASLDLLQALLDTARGTGAVPALRWCFGLRPPAPASRLATFVESLGRAGPSVTLAIAPLDAAQLAELVDSLALPGVAGAAVAPALRQRCGGNPLFVLETLKLAWTQRAPGRDLDLESTLRRLRPPGRSTGQSTGQSTGRSAAPPLGQSPGHPPPHSLAQLIAEQLGRLSAQALALARLAAVAGTDFSLALAEQVLRRDALQLADAWSELERQHVLAASDGSDRADGAGFAHDLVQEAVLAGVPAIVARQLHARVAACLEAAGGEPARVAAHWQDAGEPRRALPALRAAAARAHRALRQRERIALLVRAADIAEAEGETGPAFDSLSEALETHMNSLRDASGYPLLDRLDALARSPWQCARAAGLRAWYLSQLPDHAEAARVGQAALALAEPLADRALIGPIRQRLATALAMLGRFDEALPHLQAVQSWAESADSAGSADGAGRAGTRLEPDDLAELYGNFAVVLDNLGRVEDAQAHHRRAGALSLASGDHAQHLTHLANHAVNRLDAGDATAAADLARQAQQIALAYGLQGASVAFVALVQSRAARALGAYGEALDAAERALALLEVHNPARRPLVWVQRAACWLELGQAARAGQDLDAAMAAESALPPHVRARAHLVRARWLRATGSPGRDALAALREARAALPAQGWPEAQIAVEIECASNLPDAQALPKLQAAAARAAALGLQGCALVANVLAAARWGAESSRPLAAAEPGQEAGDPLAAARQALQSLRQVAPGAGTPAQLLHAAATALRAQGDAEAADAAARAGLDWLRSTAGERVPEPFRESFMQRVPEHKALLAWADGTPSTR
ncbi:MAG: AAA family ATPase [Burkholderiales bacterium]|nr:AAA family ATPase [Burkholderiales bacterium]